MKKKFFLKNLIDFFEILNFLKKGGESLIFLKKFWQLDFQNKYLSIDKINIGTKFSIEENSRTKFEDFRRKFSNKILHEQNPQVFFY